MVLNENFGSKPRGGIIKRTLLYVLGFGLGSLLIAGVLSFTMMSIADGVMPSGSAKKPAGTAAPKIIGAPKDGATKGKGKVAPKPASKARPGRANEGAKKGSDQPL